MDKIAEVLEALAVKLGTTVENLWPVLVSYTFTQALTALIASLIAFVFVLAVDGIILWWLPKSDNIWDDGPAITKILMGIATLIILPGLFIAIVANIPVVINPEAAALLKLLGKIGY